VDYIPFPFVTPREGNNSLSTIRACYSWLSISAHMGTH